MSGALGGRDVTAGMRPRCLPPRHPPTHVERTQQHAIHYAASLAQTQPLHSPTEFSALTHNTYDYAADVRIRVRELVAQCLLPISVTQEVFRLGQWD